MKSIGEVCDIIIERWGDGTRRGRGPSMAEVIVAMTVLGITYDLSMKEVTDEVHNAQDRYELINGLTLTRKRTV